jgi:hypothetical protein
MLELQPEYLNKIASQLIVISSLLSGFSIAVLANLLVTESEKKILNYILKITTIAASSLLVTVFSWTKIVMLTTEGYPLEIDDSDLDFTKIIAFGTFIVGIISLSLLISLSGWTKSKRTGVFTTTIGILTLIMILSALSS